MRNGARWIKAILCSCFLAGSVNLPPAFAQASPEPAELPATPEPAPPTPEDLYAQAYRFATQGDFAEAITRMLKIPPGAANYTQAQAKIKEWKGILLTRGSSYEKELARDEFEQAYFWANKGYFVRAVYEMAQIKAGTPFYGEARQKIELWKKLILAAGSSYDKELERYRRQLQGAQALADQGNFEMALLATQRVQEESPFYLDSRRQIQQWESQLARGVRPAPSPEPSESAAASAAEPMVDVSAPSSLPVWELAGQNRYGFPLGTEITPGAGLGLSWYALPQLGLHLEGNLFLSENFQAWFIPASLRFAPLQGETWRTYLGLGGFMVMVRDRLPLGALLELGADWWLTPHFGLGGSLDYGLSLSPDLGHTLGLNFALKAGF